jgi:hypothetical protein
MFGPIGTGAGALIGGIAGYMSGVENDKARKAAQNAAKIPFEDAAQAAYLGRVRRQERQQRAATDPSSAFAAMNARDALAQTQSNLLRAGGASATQGALRAQNLTNNAFMGIGATAGQRADHLLQYQGGLIDNMAQRRLDLQKDNRNQLQREYVAGRQNLYNTFSQGLGMMPGIAANKMPTFNTGASASGTPMTPSQGAIGGGWRTMGTGGIIPQSPTPVTQYPLYDMVSGQYPQAPTSGYDMGQQVNI